jgi:hypothetical protein
MVPSLRKKHRLIWIALAVLLPFLFVAALLVIPQPVYQDELPQSIAEPDQSIPSVDQPTQK